MGLAVSRRRTRRVQDGGQGDLAPVRCVQGPVLLVRYPAGHRRSQGLPGWHVYGGGTWTGEDATLLVIRDQLQREGAATRITTARCVDALLVTLNAGKAGKGS